MLEIRAWDEINKKMIQVDAINYWNKSIENEDAQQIPFTDVIIMRKSSYKDKNGNFIYEGDKLKLLDKNKEEIITVCSYGKWKRRMDSGELVEIEGFCFLFENTPTFPIIKNYIKKHDTEIMEIIGNIYEK